MKNIKYLFKSIMNYINEPLHRNAIFLIAAWIFEAIFGFIFWILAARLYSVDDVGKATALISTGSLIASFSGLGLGIGLIRYFSDTKDKSGMINTVSAIVIFFSFLLGLIFLLFIDTVSPELSHIKANPVFLLIFILFIAARALIITQLSLFVAMRRAEYSLFQSLATGIRIILLILMASLYSVGIFYSFAGGYILAIIISLTFIFILYRSYYPFTGIRWSALKEMIRFSFGNYIGDSFKILPGLIMPLLIVNILSPAMSAYFFMAWMIANMVFMIPYGTNYSLLAETSYDARRIKDQILKTIKFTFLILAPVIVLIVLLSQYILILFGENYSIEASNLLIVLVISSIPVSINEILVSIGRIKKNNLIPIAVYGFIAFFTIVSSIVFMQSTKIIGIGISWLVSNLIVAIIGIMVIYRKILSSRKQ